MSVDWQLWVKLSPRPHSRLRPMPVCSSHFSRLDPGGLIHDPWRSSGQLSACIAPSHFSFDEDAHVVRRAVRFFTQRARDHAAAGDHLNDPDQNRSPAQAA